jgi:hypothetical protein
MNVLSVVLTMLATARVTRLATTDHIFKRPRNALVRWFSERGHDQLAYLVFCPWCMSMYVGAAGAGAWYAWGASRLFMTVSGTLAASYVTGFLASVTERGE